MATTLKDTDVVIIGLGAAGGVAALPLAQAGLQVVGLEAGTWLTRRDFAPDEIRNNVRDWPQAVQKANQEVPTHRRQRLGADHTRVESPDDERRRRHDAALLGAELAVESVGLQGGERDHAPLRRSRMPTGSTVEDWPFGYDELEPYYDKVEWEIGVSGQAGNIKGTIDPRGNVFEGPRQRDYPMPPLRWTGFTDLMAAAARSARLASVRRAGADQLAHLPGSLGLHVSRLLQPRRLPRGCQERHHRHDDSARAEDRPLQRRHARARHDDRRRRQGPRRPRVSYVTDGEEYIQPAKVVLLASYTYENTRLLLLSKSKAFPNGLSNNHGQVGRHYFSHDQGGGVTALFPFNLNSWYGLPAQGVAVDNFADDNFDHGALDFIGGGNLWVYSDRRPIGAASMNTFGRAPGWGSAWKAFIKENADRVNSAYLQKTTLPYEDNFLDLDPVVKDPLGFPVCRITAEYKDNERRITAFIQDKMEQWYRAAGAVAVQRNPLGTHGPVDACVRRHAHGRQRRDQRRESLGLLARGAEPRRARRVGDGDERRAQSDAHAAGAGLADGGSSGHELEGNRRVSRRRAGAWARAALVRSALTPGEGHGRATLRRRDTHIELRTADAHRHRAARRDADRRAHDDVAQMVLVG